MASIKVSGMSCQNCVKAVTKALESIPGVEKPKVDLEKATASWEENPDLAADMELIKKTITDIGFVVE